MSNPPSDDIFVQRQLRAAEIALETARRRRFENDESIREMRAITQHAESALAVSEAAREAAVEEFQAELAAERSRTAEAEQRYVVERNRRLALDQQLSAVRREAELHSDAERQLATETRIRELEGELEMVTRRAAEFEYSATSALLEALALVRELTDRADAALGRDPVVRRAPAREPARQPIGRPPVVRLPTVRAPARPAVVAPVQPAPGRPAPEPVTADPGPSRQPAVPPAPTQPVAPVQPEAPFQPVPALQPVVPFQPVTPAPPVLPATAPEPLAPAASSREAATEDLAMWHATPLPAAELLPHGEGPADSLEPILQPSETQFRAVERPAQAPGAPGRPSSTPQPPAPAPVTPLPAAEPALRPEDTPVRWTEPAHWQVTRRRPHEFGASQRPPDPPSPPLIPVVPLELPPAAPRHPEALKAPPVAAILDSQLDSNRLDEALERLRASSAPPDEDSRGPQ